MEINFWAVLVCAVVSLVIGSIWYGPIFGKKWMQIVGADKYDMERRKQMQKEAMPLYIVQFLLSLFQAYVLAHYIYGWSEASGVENALWIVAAFVIPTTAGASMWTADSGKVKWARFLIQAGCQVVTFVAFGLILGYWR